MRIFLIISLVLIALIMYGCAGNPQPSAQATQPAPATQAQQETPANQQNAASDAETRLQDSKYSSDCMMAASQAFKSRNYGAGIENCTIAINSITDQKTKALPYRFRAALKKISGDLEAAYADYTLSISASPNDSVGYENRGCLNHIMGKTSEAKADIDKAHGLNPRLPTSDKYDFAGNCR